MFTVFTTVVLTVCAIAVFQHTTQQVRVSCDGNPSDAYFCSKTTSRVYVENVWLVEANPATFHFLGADGYYATDGTHVYWVGGLDEGPTPFEIPGADPTTFAPMPNHEGYATDRNNVYLLGQVIPEAAPRSFVPLYPPRQCGSHCSYSAEDKSQKYDAYGRIVICCSSIS